MMSRAVVVQLLALHDGVMHGDRLVAELCPDDPPWGSQQRLRSVLSRLRGHTGGLVGRDPRRTLVRYTQPARIEPTEFLHLSANAIRSMYRPRCGHRARHSRAMGVAAGELRCGAGSS